MKNLYNHTKCLGREGKTGLYNQERMLRFFVCLFCNFTDLKVLVYGFNFVRKRKVVRRGSTL